jgi:hypothetical protein
MLQLFATVLRVPDCRWERQTLGRPRRRWVDLVEVGWGDVDSIGLAQNRGRWRALVNSVLNFQVP